MTLRVGRREATLKHFANAHTDGDTYVYFADANVLATDVYLNLAIDGTKIVPGHGPLTNRAGIAAYRDMLVTARDRVARLVADGKSLDEAVAAKPFAEIGAKIGANEEQNADFVRVIYRSLKP
jgi:cyclase